VRSSSSSVIALSTLLPRAVRARISSQITFRRLNTIRIAFPGRQRLPYRTSSSRSAGWPASPSCHSRQASLTVKTRTRAVSIGGLVALLVAGVAVVVVAATGLPITAAGTGIIASGAAGATRGPPPKVKVIGIYKTLSSWACRACSVAACTCRAAACWFASRWTLCKTASYELLRILLSSGSVRYRSRLCSSVLVTASACTIAVNSSHSGPQKGA
jgi:hypothetical protein